MVTTYEVTAELNVADSGRGTLRSARNEALRSAEQKVLNEIKAGKVNKASDYQYDLQNRLTEINIQGLPVFGKDLLKQTIQMEYDERGNLIKTTSGNSVLSQYTFDTANRLSETTNVLRIKTNFIYDGAGRRVKMQINLILAATIYAEQRLNVDWKDDLIDGIGGFYGIDTSIGVAQVRVSTTKLLEDKGYMPKISAQDGGWNIPVVGFVNGTETMARAKALENPETSIMYAAAYLSYIQDIWKDAYPQIDGRTAILATLFNIGEYGSKGVNCDPESTLFGDFAKENYYDMRKLLGLD